MLCPRSVAVTLAAGSLLAAGAAHGQSTLNLRPAIEEMTVPPPAPTLEVKPLEEIPPAPRKRARRADPYAPIGLRMGGITVFPAVTVGGGVSSNARRSATNAQPAVGLKLEPSLRFESDWVRHSWTGGASGDFIRYLKHGDITSNSADIFSNLRLDVRHDTRADIDVSYTFDQSGLEDSDVPAAAVGYRNEHTAIVSGAVTHDFGLMQARVKAGGTGKIFDDVELAGGGSEDNSDRDYIEPSVSLRATYSDPPVFKPFVESAYLPRIYDKKFDRFGFRRSSQGYSASAGVIIDNEPFLTGELAATYLFRDYDYAGLASNDAVGLTGNLTWSPTELTKMTLTAGTSLSDTVSATSSSNRVWTVRVDASQALRDNVDLLAGAGVEIEDGSAGNDVTYDTTLGISWKLGPSLAWTASYDATWLDAASSGRSYSEHRVSTGLTLSR